MTGEAEEATAHKICRPCKREGSPAPAATPTLVDGCTGRMMAPAERRGRVGVVEGRGGEVAGGEAAGVTVQVWRWCTWTAGGGNGSVGHEGAR